MSAKHSPEPWRFRTPGETPDGYPMCGSILQGKCTWIGDVKGLSDECVSNGHRIVACVNFCQHMSTELIEELSAAEIGPATLAQLAKQSWLLAAYDGHLACPSCGNLVGGFDDHDEDCQIPKLLKLMEKYKA